SDGDFGHCHLGRGGDDSIRCCTPEADTATHRNAVHPRNDRLGITMNEFKEPVLSAEEILNIGSVVRRHVTLGAIHGSQITASAECFLATGVDPHANDFSAIRPVA